MQIQRVPQYMCVVYIILDSMPSMPQTWVLSIADPILFIGTGAEHVTWIWITFLLLNYSSIFLKILAHSKVTVRCYIHMKWYYTKENLFWIFENQNSIFIQTVILWSASHPHRKCIFPKFPQYFQSHLNNTVSGDGMFQYPISLNSVSVKRSCITFKICILKQLYSITLLN